MTRSLVIILSFLLTLTQCKPGDTYSPHGYRYEMHMDAPGEVIKPGEYAYFSIELMAEDSLLNSSSSMTELPRIRIPLEDEYAPESSPFIDGLRLMSVGDSMTLHFPIDEMEAVPAVFQQYEELSYNLKMIEIKSEEAFQEEMKQLAHQRDLAIAAVRAREPEISELAQRTLAAYNNNALELEDAGDGLKYIIHEQGDGPTPDLGQNISVQYYGLMENGLMFDTSFRNGEPYTFAVGYGRVIDGWDKALMLFNEGTRASLFVPAALGYGASGYQDVPGGADLYFYVELEKMY